MPAKKKKKRNGFNRSYASIPVNKATIKNSIALFKTGRPRIFKTPQAMQKRIIEYIEHCENTGLHLTVPGLALSLDMSRESLLRYETEEGYKQFRPTIKKAKQFIEQYKNQLLLEKMNPAGVIFDLKNNHAWFDKIELEKKESKEVIFGIIGQDGKMLDPKHFFNTGKQIEDKPLETNKTIDVESVKVSCMSE